MLTLQILTAIAGLVAMFLKTVWPTFPLDDVQILALFMFLLGLIGVVPQLMFRRGLTGTDGWLRSKAFWLALVGAANIALHAYLPDFPLVAADLAALVFWVLSLNGIVPEVKALRAKFGLK